MSQLSRKVKVCGKLRKLGNRIFPFFLAHTELNNNNNGGNFAAGCVLVTGSKQRENFGYFIMPTKTRRPFNFLSLARYIIMGKFCGKACPVVMVAVLVVRWYY